MSDTKDDYFKGATREDLEWWWEVAPDLEWRWAYTYAKHTPHWYLLREKCSLTEDEYRRALRVIWTFGHPEQYYKNVNLYLHDRDGRMKVFATGPGNFDNALINRGEASRFYGVQEVPDTTPSNAVRPLDEVYNRLAIGYDGRYETDVAAHENAYVWKLCTEPPYAHDQKGKPSMLDIGAGTGLAIDIGIAPTLPHLYRAVDPSQGMLNQMILNHKWVRDIQPMTCEDYLNGPQGKERFDTTVTLFGAASYLQPESLEGLLAITTRLAVFMFYKPGYRPDFYTDETWPAEVVKASYDRGVELAEHPPLGWQARLDEVGTFQIIRFLRNGFVWA